MVQGLAFLSKKSWHTKNLNNQEKVWIAEERKKAEARKTQELQKQIQQELEQQELDAIAGRTSRRDRGIDWMYEHGPTSETARLDSEKKSEEYLLGKEYVPDGAPKGDLDVDKAQEGVNKVVSSASAAAASAASYSRDEPSGTHYAPAELSVKERNEAFTLRFEDPMFMVAQRAADMERKLERNKQLLERVTGAVAVDVTEVVETKRNKEKKKRRDRGEKKSSKKRRRSPSVDSRSDSGRSEDRRYRRKSPPRRRDRISSAEPRDRERSNRPDVEGSRGQSSDYRQSDSWPDDRMRSEYPKGYRDESRKNDRRSRSRSLSPSPQRGRHSRHKSSPYDDAGYRAHSSSSGHFDSRREDGSRERDRSHYANGKHDAPDPRYKHRESSDHRADDRKPAHRESSNHRHDDRKPAPSSDANRRGAFHDSDRRYGLQGASKLDDRRPEKLGPDEELLKKKRDEREDQKRQMEHAARRRRMTPEERAKALEEMEANARTYDSHRASKLRSSHHREEDDNDGAHVGRGSSSATFLNEIQRSAYGVDQGISMQERLQQNRNSHQRSHDKFL